MMCAIFSTQNCSGTYYSSMARCYENENMKNLLNDFSTVLKDGECVAVTVDSNEDVVLIELLGEGDWNAYGEPELGQPLCYNVMKAFCQAYGIGMAIPEYVGPYTLEVARRAYDDCKDYMIIIPVMEEGEVCCVS